MHGHGTHAQGNFDSVDLVDSRCVNVDLQYMLAVKMCCAVQQMTEFRNIEVTISCDVTPYGSHLRVICNISVKNILYVRLNATLPLVMCF